MDDVLPACAFTAVRLEEPGHAALEHLSFSVASGEIVMLSGPSGVGKSLVLRAAVGLCAAHAGRVELFGEHLGALDHDGLMRVRQRVAYASETAPLLANQSVRDNLATPLLLRGMGGREARRRVDETMERLGIGEHGRFRPHELPPVVQRLSIVARALAMPADLLVLDEPSRGLSDERNDALAALLLERRNAGAALLIGIGDPSRWEGRVTRGVSLASPLPPR